ncbi:hypothetical protein [Arthrobacter sp. B0490]|nr:hypothetical protein [Arthrobacter sp. B0490]
MARRGTVPADGPGDLSCTTTCLFYVTPEELERFREQLIALTVP